MKIFTFFVILLITTNLFAQSPEKFSYQAVVRNAANKLVVNQEVSVQLSIIQGSPTGTALYVETQNPTTNANGLLSLEVGTGNVMAGSFEAIDWSNGLHFLKTDIDITGGIDYTISGTNQLLSVPYALYAKRAGDTHWQTSGEDIFYNNGDIGIGTDSPKILNYTASTQVITLQGTATSIEMAGNRQSDGQSLGWLTYFNGPNRIMDIYTTREDNGTSGSLIIRTNNGIGGTSPANMVKQFTLTHEGDVYLNNSSNGVIMKSPNQQCWKMTVDNNGNLVTVEVTCPD